MTDTCEGPRIVVKRRATSKDVADLAGVSRAAVSLVLNGRAEGNVSAAKEAAIRAAAAELDYTPNSVARSLQAQRTRTLGVVTDAIATTAFGGRILSGATMVAAAAGYVLLVIDTRAGDDLETSAWASLRARQVDGLLFAAMGLRPYAPPPMMQELPSVLVNCFDPREGVASVACDEVQGGRTAARALLDHGHRDVAMLAGTGDVIATHRRVQGFTEELDAVGIDVRVIPAGWEIRDGYSAAAAVLDGAHRPTGIVCANDRAAVGVVLAAAELGLSVPRDLSVVGYDDDENVAPVMVPPLTTVALPHSAMGREAVRRVLAGAAGEPVALDQVLLPCPLVTRDSVARPGR